MKVFILIIIMVSLQNMAKASDDTVGTNGLSVTELSFIDNMSTNEEIRMNDCLSDSDETEVVNTACINEVFGDIY